MNKALTISDLVGSTPLLQINRLNPANGSRMLAKLESQNPGASVKDRLALAMINAGEKEGFINPETVIIEPTSGNTGIGLAMICAARGYRLIITMPESVSLERRNTIRAYGAELHITSQDEGMKGAIAKAHMLQEQYPNSFIPMQFSNLANAQMHRETTAEEIWRDTDGEVDIFVAGVGTGGTITGVGEVLKDRKPGVQIVAVEPAGSAILSGNEPGKHKIQGIGAGFIPEVLNTSIYDEVIQVSDQDAMHWARRMAREEGIFGGISSGAIFYASRQLAERPENKNKNIVFIVCDTGERYLSTPLYENEQI
jgi:cysteine synthase A